ncbi:hypothetical protein [Lysobacter gummosus]|uniref:hypothetical protein n=1 Tax=Lysobacter gummosus TaxID=262324 RepID=UPI00362A7CD4
MCSCAICTASTEPQARLVRAFRSRKRPACGPFLCLGSCDWDGPIASESRGPWTGQIRK